MDAQKLLQLSSTIGVIFLILGILLLSHRIILTKVETSTKININRFGKIFTTLGIILLIIHTFLTYVK